LTASGILADSGVDILEMIIDPIIKHITKTAKLIPTSVNIDDESPLINNLEMIGGKTYDAIVASKRFMVEKKSLIKPFKNAKTAKIRRIKNIVPSTKLGVRLITNFIYKV